MLILFRIFMVSLIIYLIIRAFSRYNTIEDSERKDSVTEKKDNSRKISKKTGEYIDFEDKDK